MSSFSDPTGKDLPVEPSIVAALRFFFSRVMLFSTGLELASGRPISISSEPLIWGVGSEVGNFLALVDEEGSRKLSVVPLLGFLFLGVEDFSAVGGARNTGAGAGINDLRLLGASSSESESDDTPKGW